jgi:hypothetical protein
MNRILLLLLLLLAAAGGVVGSAPGPGSAPDHADVAVRHAAVGGPAPPDGREHPASEPGLLPGGRPHAESTPTNPHAAGREAATAGGTPAEGMYLLVCTYCVHGLQIQTCSCLKLSKV